MPPKYVYNYVAMTDGDDWFIYHKQDKRIPKTVECYGNRFLSKSKTLKNAIENLENPRNSLLNSRENLPKKFEIQVVQNV